MQRDYFTVYIAREVKTQNFDILFLVFSPFLKKKKKGKMNIGIDNHSGCLRACNKNKIKSFCPLLRT
jgi:hypothetical protein